MNTHPSKVLPENYFCYNFLQKKTKYTATRRLLLKSKLLKKATSMLVAEKEQNKRERDNALNERVPPLKLSGLSAQELQELCKELHQKIDVVDEARYDLEVKVVKNEKEIQSLTQKIWELKGTMKRTQLKRVKRSADDKLGALTESKMSSKSDFKANLKTVKKDEEKKEEVTDWRKNVEAMSGMEGRKKLFNAGQS
nr:troponin I, slow skeletal muscle [Misgurnus anguillicaudatus]